MIRCEIKIYAEIHCEKMVYKEARMNFCYKTKKKKVTALKIIFYYNFLHSSPYNSSINNSSSKKYEKKL